MGRNSFDRVSHEHAADRRDPSEVVKLPPGARSSVPNIKTLQALKYVCDHSAVPYQYWTRCE